MSLYGFILYFIFYRLMFYVFILIYFTNYGIGKSFYLYYYR